MAASAKTCSLHCRQARARRRKAKRKETSAIGAAARAIPQEWKDALEDVGHEVMADELRPIVREELLTPEAVESLGELVGLLPNMISALATDLQDRDPTVRQKAYTLGLRYTLGHEKVLPSDAQHGSNLTVVLGAGMVPPSADTSPPVESTAEEERLDTRICDTCEQPKPLDEYIGTAMRCNSCVAELRERAARILEPPKDG